MVRRVLLLVVGLTVLVAVGVWTRKFLGLEISPEAVRGWVQGFGWWAPAVYVSLVAFRHFLLLPSTILLTVGGICFGIVVGGLLGTLGVAITGMLEFSAARTVRPHWLIDRAGSRRGTVRRAVENGAPAAVAISTAIPISPMSFFHVAAAFTPMSFASFLLPLFVGALVRAFALSYLGAGLVSAEPGQLVIAGIGVALLVIVPLAHPTLRRRFLLGGDD